LNPLFQLSTRNYDKEILLVKQALANLETECNVKNGYTIEKPFKKSGIMEGALGYSIGEQMTNFVGHYLETKGSNVRIKKIDYG